VVVEWTCEACPAGLCTLRAASLALMRRSIMQHVRDAHPGVDAAAVTKAIDGLFADLLRTDEPGRRQLTPFDQAFLRGCNVSYG